MAEITSATQSDKKGGQKRKVLSTRVDLTPMVDLGFLLITFFIFTTKMGEARGMKIKVPDDRNIKDSSTTAEGKTLNLILGPENKVWYYNGKSLDRINATNSTLGIRAVIMEKKEWVRKTYGSGKELVILIKPTASCSFKNIIDILDEMLINEVTRYMIVEPATYELSTSVKNL